MNKFRMLKFYELFNSSLMGEVGIKSSMTDLANITGVNKSPSSNGSYYVEGQNKNIAIVNPCGFIKEDYEYLDNTGIRPVIGLDDIDINKLKKVEDGPLPVVEFGKYPTSLVDNHTKDILDALYSIKKLDKVGEYTLGYKSTLISNVYNKNNNIDINYKNEYPLDADEYKSNWLLNSEKYLVDASGFKPDWFLNPNNYKLNADDYKCDWFPKLPDTINKETFGYVVDQKRNTRIKKFDSFSFNNNEYVKFNLDDKDYWLKVEKVLWYVDTKINALISKDVLIRGIDADSCNIKDSNILDFMNNYMGKDMGIYKENKKIKTYSL